ncbi:DNA adenine methylase [Micromonospora sp. MW-13]|uniref:DNA adenine methylase n=1 Tax=Micromonospora sp. MW-13 TaxID=2094022 RepID=UPI001404A7BE|nr:DNA adenine methylase [Micromonospora sp. MW-13]
MGKAQETRYSSPLRYPGGKGKVANFVKLLVLENSLIGSDYIEPYAGGASVALSLLFEDYINHAYINDINDGVYCFWRFALEDPDSLCRRIMTVPLTIDEWRRQKLIHSSMDSSPEDIGFSTFYLNRTNRSGIVSGGVIGGTGQAGIWKIDARFNREALCSRVRKIAGYSSRITVSKVDAAEMIESELVRGRSHRLLYLDPPYFVKGEGLYDNFYGFEDHRKVRDAVSATPGPWVVSYDAAPEILQLYSQHEPLRYTLSYSASRASKGTEVMYFSPNLLIPKVASPAGISVAEVTKAMSAATLF